jgi:PAS domain S-box-containing protein
VKVAGEQQSDPANQDLSLEIAERKRAEEKLRQSEAYLAEAQKLTHTGSWVWEVAGKRALHLSDEWYRVYGFDPSDGLAAWEKRLQRIHPDDRAKWQTAIERAIDEHSEYELEFRILLPAGVVKHLYTVGHPVEDGSGKLVRFVGSSTDVTERKQAEEALRQAQADLARISRVTTMGELTASLAHEVNQPIGAAVTDANTCLSRAQPRASIWKRLAKPPLESSKMLPCGGSHQRTRCSSRRELRNRLVDIKNDYSRDAGVDDRRHVGARIAVRLELAEDLPHITGDRVQLQQAHELNGQWNHAMKDSDGTRELAIKSRRAEKGSPGINQRYGCGLPQVQATDL